MLDIRSQRFAICIFALAAAGFFFVSISPEIDLATAPGGYGIHTLLRKSYSVAVFALLGYLLSWARRQTATVPLLLNALSIGFFSGLIEFFQRQTGSREGLAWNAADVIMGVLGGCLGALFYARPKKWL